MGSGSKPKSLEDVALEALKVRDRIVEKVEEFRREVLESVSRSVESRLREFESKVKTFIDQIALASRTKIESIDLLEKVLNNEGVIAKGEFTNNLPTEEFITLLDYSNICFDDHTSAILRRYRVKPKHRVRMVVIAWQEPESI